MDYTLTLYNKDNQICNIKFMIKRLDLTVIITLDFF